MKARMEVTLDTIWTNQVVASVECEFDNPHLLTAQMLSELMVHRLNLMVEEIRHANERAKVGFAEASGVHVVAEPDRLPREGTQQREQEEFEEMRRGRGEESMFTERRAEREPQE